jgi:hypothetical protein
MTDTDRGVYTPYSRDELAFDPREARRRRPVPLTLMASAFVLVALGGAAVMFYQSGVRGRNEPPRAVGTQVGSIKTPPTQDAKPVDPALDVYVVDRNEPGADQPTYTPGPEQPQPRDAVPAAVEPPPATTPAAKPVVAANAYQAVDAAPDADAPPPAKPAKVAKKVVVADTTPAKADTLEPHAWVTGGADVATPVAAPVKAKDAAKAKVAAKGKDAKADKAAAVAGGSEAVQIGAYSSKALAEQEFAKVRGGFGKFVSGRSTHVESVKHGSATLYRAAFTGFSKHQAQAFCGALKAAGRACIVK